MPPLDHITTTYPDGLSPSQVERIQLYGADVVQDNFEVSLDGSEQFVYHFSSDQEPYTMLHYHNFYEFIYCRQVEGIDYILGQQRYRPRSGDIICVPPGVQHMPLFYESHSTMYIRDVFHVDDNWIQRLGYAVSKPYICDCWQPCLLQTTGTQWEYLGDLFRRGCKETNQKAPFWKDYIVGNTLLLTVELNRILTSENLPATKSEPPQLFDRIICYIEDRLDQRITLEATAQFFYVSKSTVTRIFQKHTGTSFYRYVTQCRLIAAKERILSGEALESVSEAVGFSDYPTFYRAFKQEYGISPSQFRREQNR